MHGLGRRKALATLRAQVAALENRPVLAPGAAALRAAAGAGPLLAPPGLLHEVFTDSPVNAGAALGFALGQARGLVGGARPVVLFLQLRHEGQETGLPYGAGLSHFGFDPGALLIGRVKDMPDLLWVMEEALGCRAVAAVIADIGGWPRALDFTASRRLSLRANSAGASVLLLRYGAGRMASAAQLRWHVLPAPSQAPRFDAQAPGAPRWQVRLEKGALGSRRAPSDPWQIGWIDHGFVEYAPGSGRRHARPPLHGLVPAALGHRFSQTA